ARQVDAQVPEGGHAVDQGQRGGASQRGAARIGERHGHRVDAVGGFDIPRGVRECHGGLWDQDVARKRWPWLGHEDQLRGGTRGNGGRIRRYLDRGGQRRFSGDGG